MDGWRWVNLRSPNFLSDGFRLHGFRVAQEALEHKDISTAQIYTHIVAEEKKKAVGNLPY